MASASGSATGQSKPPIVIWKETPEGGSQETGQLVSQSDDTWLYECLPQGRTDDREPPKTGKGRTKQSTVQIKPSIFDGTDLLQIGFMVGGSFKKQIEILYDKTRKTTIYSKHTLIPETQDPETAGYNKRAPYYPPKEPFTEVLTSLGLQHLGQLDMGHLTPRADFQYEFERNATNYLINTVPMWSKVNRRKWSTLEKEIRDLANERGNKLTIYTGGYGTFKMENGEPLYMSNDNKMPVPEILYKIVHDEVNDSASAFVVRNVPDKEYSIQEKREVEEFWYSFPGNKTIFCRYDMKQFFIRYTELKKYLEEYKLENVKNMFPQENAICTI